MHVLNCGGGLITKREHMYAWGENANTQKGPCQDSDWEPSSCEMRALTPRLNQIKSSKTETHSFPLKSKKRHHDLFNGERMVFNGTGMRQI